MAPIRDTSRLIRDTTKTGLTIQETAEELKVSTRTVIRMLKDGRLKATKVPLPWGKEGKFLWVVDPMSIARFQVRKEMKAENKAQGKPKSSGRMANKATQGTKEG
jgi:excisionase family DNA binding protein